MRGDVIKVVIASKSPIVRFGLTHVLHEAADVKLVGDIDDLSNLVQVMSRVEADVGIVENCFAQREVVDLLEDLNATSGAPALVLSEQTDSCYLESLLCAGARGLMLTREPTEFILPALQEILKRGMYLSDGVNQILKEVTDKRPSGVQSSIDQLTNSELKIFELMGMGFDTNEIGLRLHIGTKTVETHRRQLRLKFGLGNSNQLLRRAMLWVVQERGKLPMLDEKTAVSDTFSVDID